MHDDKLVMQGAASSEDVVNSVWNAIKAVDPAYSDLVCKITIDSSLPPPPPEVTGNTALPIPKYDVAGPPPPPCGGCVELSVVLNDINQRDEFALDARGASVTRVTWTLLVNLNSDQLAVQPFVNDRKGKYTEIDANAFPLGKPVELVQEFQGTAQRVGLIDASSDAWTGAQRVSVFVDAVRAEGPGGFRKTFDSSAEGFTPRTQTREPRVDFHATSTAAN